MASPRVRDTARQRLAQHTDERFQHELKEMQETGDLRKIDDDVEQVATLFEWRAESHNHRPKSASWYIVLAVVVTILVCIYLFSANFIGALAMAFIGAMIYIFAQRPPSQVRYRLMVDGVALNNTLYHYRDLLAFNIVYEPGHTKTVILRSKQRFTPLLHMELGDADPVAIRDILLEFVPEDQDLEEPLVDILARRVGF